MERRLVRHAALMSDECQPRGLHRSVECGELQQLERDAVGFVLEPAVTLPVTDEISPRLVPNRERRRAPERTAFLVADIQDFPRRVAHWIVRPGSQLGFLAGQRTRESL